MVGGESRLSSEYIEADLFIEMPFDIVADAACHGGRQPAPTGVPRRGHEQNPQCTKAPPAVNHNFRLAACDLRSAQRRCQQCGPTTSVATSTHQAYRNVMVGRASEE